MHVGEAELTLAGIAARARVVLCRDMLSFGLYPEEALKAVMENAGDGLVCHDGKKLLHTASDMGLSLPEITFDTMLAAYLLSPQEKSYALREFA